jgi:hypothetical protein
MSMEIKNFHLIFWAVDATEMEVVLDLTQDRLAQGPIDQLRTHKSATNSCSLSASSMSGALLIQPFYAA